MHRCLEPLALSTKHRGSVALAGTLSKMVYPWGPKAGCGTRSMDRNETRFPLRIILANIRWYRTHALGCCNIGERMRTRGVLNAHTTINRWAINFLPTHEQAFEEYRCPAGGSWHMDETCYKVGGQWKHLHFGVDKKGAPVDCVRHDCRDTAAATGYFKMVRQQNGEPEKITADESGANKAAEAGINQICGVPIAVRQIKHLINIAEQQYRAVKHITKPMLEFTSFRAADAVLAGAGLMRVIRKGKLGAEKGSNLTLAERFYPLAGQARARIAGA